MRIRFYRRVNLIIRIIISIDVFSTKLQFVYVERFVNGIVFIFFFFVNGSKNVSSLTEYDPCREIILTTTDSKQGIEPRTERKPSFAFTIGFYICL